MAESEGLRLVNLQIHYSKQFKEIFSLFIYFFCPVFVVFLVDAQIKYKIFIVVVINFMMFSKSGILSI